MSEKPFVSVVIPTYNRASTVSKAVMSVLNQTYRELELIVVDDGSTDNTLEVLSAIDDPRLRCVCQENRGACAARNLGIDEACGEILAFNDSDDLWEPDKLEKQLGVMARTRADLVFCKLSLHREGRVQKVFPRYIHEGFVRPGDDLLGIGTQTVIVRRQVTEQERFDPAMPRYQDLEWIFRIIQRFRVYCMEEPLVEYIRSSDSISMNQEKMYAALALFYKKYGCRKRQYPMLFMHFVRDLAEGFFLAGQKKTGSVKFIRLMTRYYPGTIRFLRALYAWKKEGRETV